MARPRPLLPAADLLIRIALTSLLILLFARPLWAAEGQEYVDKKAGFRLKVPTGWEKVKVEHMSVAFRGPKALVEVAAEAADLSPEEYVALTKKNLRSGSDSTRIASEEEAVLAGLPARKLVFRWEQGNAAFRGWSFIVLSNGEYWLLMVVGGDSAWPASGTPEEAEIVDMIASFELLEPTLSRVKAGVPPYLMASMPKAGTRTRYFVNDAVGMKVLLPAGWEMAEDDPGGYDKPAQVGLTKPGTLTRLSLVHQTLEASPELYEAMGKKNLSSGLEDFRLLSEERVQVGGLSGLRLAFQYKSNNIPLRSWFQIFTSGKDHFVVETVASQELFDTYKESFEQVLNSVRFTALERASAGTQQAAIASALAPSSGAATGAPASDVERLKRALEINPNDVEAHVNLGNALDDSGDHQGAIEEYKAALRVDPNVPQAHRNLGLTYWRVGNLKDAEKEVREAVRLKPDYQAARATLVGVLMDRNNYDAAFSELRDALQLDRQYPVENTRASLLKAEQQDFDRASAAAVAHFTVGVTLLNRDKLEDAAKQFRGAIQEDARFALPHQALAAVEVQKNNFAAAAAEAQAALQLDPQLPNPHFLLGLTAFAQNHDEEAAKELQAAIQLEPRMARAHLYLAKTYFRLKKPDQTMSEALASLAADPTMEPGPTHTILAVLYLSRSDFPLAWQHAQEAQRNGAPLPPEFQQALAEVYPEAKLEELRGRLEKLRQAVRENYADAQRHADLGDALNDTGDFEGSSEEYEKALSFNPSLAAAHNGLGQLAYRKGDPTGAAGHWQESLRVEPAQADAHFYMARMYNFDEATRSQAAEQFEEFLRRVNHSQRPAEEIVSAYVSLGSIYSAEKVGREKDAFQKYEEGLKSYPESALLLNEAAWRYATCKDLALRDPQKALAYATKAVTNSGGKSAAYVDTLAEAYYVNGQFKKAVETETKALALAPDSASMKKAIQKYERAAKTGKP